MIAYLNGNLEYVSNDFVILDVNGIGYQVFISDYTLSKLPQCNSNLKLYTYMNVKEDSISLYGFLSMDEMNMFNTLKTVSGVGPKAALSILSCMRPNEISMAVIIEDINSLSKASGIGKKTAQRIILELKDKMKSTTVFETENIDTNKNSSSAKIEAVEALTALGYSQIEATRAVSGEYSENMKVEDIIKLALKKMSKN